MMNMLNGWIIWVKDIYGLNKIDTEDDVYVFIPYVITLTEEKKGSSPFFVRELNSSFPKYK